MALQKLVENFAKDWKDDSIKPEKLKLNESNNKVIIENKEVKVSSGYLVPVWRLDKRNLNERIYTTKLAKKVIKENKITLALKNHPENDDFDVDNIVAVGKNPQIRNGILFAECYFVDEEFEKKAEKIIEYGAGLGLSSSALGSLNENHEVVVEDFILERYFDFVGMPSYEVYLTKESQIQENKEKDTEDKIEESTEENTETIIEDIEQKEEKIESKEIQEDVNNNNLNKLDDIMKPNKKYNLEEKNFIISMTNFIKEANEISEIENKIAKFNELLEWCEGEADYIDPIRDIIKENLEVFNKEYDTLAMKGKQTDSLIKEKEEKEKELESVNETLNKEKSDKEDLYEKFDELKEHTNKLSSLYEETIKEKEALETKIKESMIEKDTYNKVVEYVEKLEKAVINERDTVKTLNEKITSLEKNLEDIKKKELEEKLELEKLIKESEEKKLIEKIEKEKEEKRLKEEAEAKTSQFDLYKDEVKSLYEDWVKQDPSLDKFKDLILSCRNIREAQSKRLQIKKLTMDQVEYKAPTIGDNDILLTEKTHKDQKDSYSYLDW